MPDATVNRVQDSLKQSFHLFIVVVRIICQVGPGQSDRHGDVGYFRFAVQNRIYDFPLLGLLRVNDPIVSVFDRWGFSTICLANGVQRFTSP
jgi:hypothetical protein